MSQGSNFKKQVMEALFNAPTNLINNKAIMWALSNLPDEGGMGTEDTSVRGEYRHDDESFWTAIGMNSEIEKVGKKWAMELFTFVQANQESDKLTKSVVFEHMEKVCGNEGIMFLASQGFMKEYHEFHEAHAKAALAAGLEEMGLSGEIDPEVLKKAISIHEMMRKLDELKKRLGGDQ